MAATVALLQHFTHGTVYYIETSYCVHGTVHSFIAHTKSKHFNTRSNHYYGKSLYTLPNQTLPYRLLYNPAFLHMTVLCCLQSPPPPPANIYIERRPCCGGGGEGTVHRTVHSFIYVYFNTELHDSEIYISIYCIPRTLLH